MSDIIHVTAQYSNALLVAALPYVSHAIKALDLPIPQPVTLAQVREAHPQNWRGSPISIFLTNGDNFGVDQRGFVNAYRKREKNYFCETDGSLEWSKSLLGPDHMTTNEVVELARKTLLKLGFGPDLTHADQPPDEIRGPWDYSGPVITGHVPFCQVEWDTPYNSFADVEVNMNTREVVGWGMGFSYWTTNHEPTHLPTVPLKVGVVPESEDALKKRAGRIFVDTNAPSRFPHFR